MQRLTLRLGFAVLGLSLLAACQDNPAAGPEVVVDDPLVRQVQGLGFRGDMVKDFGAYLLVEGDIVLPKDRLGAAPAAPSGAGGVPGPRYQYSTTALVSTPNVSNIRVDLSQIGGNPEWQTATRDAMTSWNAVQYSNIRFVEATPGDITVTTECRFDGVIGRAVFPTGGGVGNQVVYNICWVVNGLSVIPTAGQRQYNAAHELGHTVGFRHSNWNSNDCFGGCGGNPGPDGANLIAGTPTSDGASVMNGGTATNSWNGFSTNDQLAARTLYPLPKPTVTVTNVGGFPQVSWTASGKATSFSVTLIYNRNYREPLQRPVLITEPTLLANSATSPYLDSANPYTGIWECDWSDPVYYPVDRLWYRYEVKATHAGGGETRGFADAPIIDGC